MNKNIPHTKELNENISHDNFIKTFFGNENIF